VTVHLNEVGINVFSRFRCCVLAFNWSSLRFAIVRWDRTFNQ